MDSEMDLFLPALSTTQGSVETEFRKLKKGRSIYTIWVHTCTARDGKNSRFKFYIHCTETPSYSTSITINMRGYLELKYGITID
jgi:hypothetical protein